MTSKSDCEKGYYLNKKKIIQFCKIIYCQAEGCYTRIYLENESFLISKILKKIEKELPADQFFRIDRSVLINIQCINSLDDKSVILKNGLKLKVSRRKKAGLVDALQKDNLIIGLDYHAA